MPTAYRFRLYPSGKQETRMLRTLEACRRLWNDGLHHRNQRWQDERKSTSYNHQQWILTAERHADQNLGAVHSQVAQDVLHRLDRAFKAFFQQRSRYPRFKKFSESGSFTYPQGYNGSAKPDPLRRRLFLSKIGNVPVVFHRKLPKDCRVKTCTVTREPDGKWFASMVFEEVVLLQNFPTITVSMVRAPIGVDLGLMSLIATSDGEKVEHPHFLRKAERKLNNAQRSLSRKKKGSNNWFKARMRVASQYARVRRRRLDFNHKLSKRMVRGHDFIAFEDLRTRNMMRNHALAKSINDAGWGQLVSLTEYKASNAGVLVIKVEPSYSTQECFHCGARSHVGLSSREFACRGCERTLDRDVNAAKVVLKRGLFRVGLDKPKLKPAEIGPLRAQTTGHASPIVETGTKSDGHV